MGSHCDPRLAGKEGRAPPAASQQPRRVQGYSRRLLRIPGKPTCPFPSPGLDEQVKLPSSRGTLGTRPTMRDSQVGGSALAAEAFRDHTSCSTSKKLQIDLGRALAPPIVATESPGIYRRTSAQVPEVRASRIDRYLAAKLQHGASRTLGTVPLRCGKLAKYNVAAAEPWRTLA